VTEETGSIEVDGLMIDLDGVVARGNRPIEGAAQAIEDLRSKGIRLVFATNNATATIEQRLDKLSSLGLKVTEDELVTSAVVTAEELAIRGFGGSSAFVIGKDGIRAALADVGIETVAGRAGESAPLVVVSGDDGFDYEAMRVASTAVRNGAFFVATNDDVTFPTSRGLVPGAGAILASVITASGRTPEIMGKPFRPMMEAAARRLEGCQSIGVIGDQPATDLAGAQEMGWRSILVLSGVTSAEAAAGVSPRPDLVIDTIVDAAAVLRGARG